MATYLEALHGPLARRDAALGPLGFWVVKRDGEAVRAFPLSGMTTPAMKAAYDEARSWAHEQNQREEQTA